MAEVEVEFTSDVSKILRDQQKLIMKQEELIRSLRNTQRQSERNKKQWDQTAASGRKATGDITAGFGRAMLGMATFERLLGGVIRLLQDARQEADAFGRSLVESSQGAGLLAQLAGGDPAEFERLTARARQMFGRGIGTSVTDAVNIDFAITSAQLDESARRLVETGAITQALPDPAAMANQLSGVEAAFGAEEVGGMNRLVAETIVASGRTRAPAAPILRAAAEAGASASGAGFGEEEAITAAAIVGQVLGEEQTRTSVRALFEALNQRPELVTGELPQVIEELAALGPELQGTVGTATAAQAIQILGNRLPEFQDALQAVEAADAASAMRTAMLPVTGEGPAATAQRSRIRTMQQERQLQLAGEDALGVQELDTDAVIAARQAAMVRSGRTTGIERALVRGGSAFTRLFFEDERSALIGGEIARSLPTLVNPVTAIPGQTDLDVVARRIYNAATALEGAADGAADAARSRATAPQE